jgi:hypothetical protein
MNMIKGRSQAISAANDERRQVLPSRVIWDGSIDRFEVFRNSVEGHYGQVCAGYFFDNSFYTAYLEKGVDCYVDFMHEVPSASQNKKDTRALYVTLFSNYQRGVGQRILIENRSMPNVIRPYGPPSSTCRISKHNHERIRSRFSEKEATRNNFPWAYYLINPNNSTLRS